MSLFRKIRAALALAAGLALAAAGGAARAAHDLGPKPPGQFDYYVLSLSSVPGFCATNKSAPAECKRGLTFALHGLWPQDNGGGYPTDCSKVALTPADIQTYQGVYADPSLIKHEWPKHGTCSGLAPAAYFTLSSADVQKVKLPDAYGPKTVIKPAQAKAVKAAFVAANPGLPADGINTVVVKGVVTEVDICMTKDGAFQACK